MPHARAFASRIRRPLPCAVPVTRLLVLADAHIGPATHSTEQSLLAFLDAVPDLGDGLLIVGDLFDFWFGYRRAIPRHAFRVAAGLSTVSRRLPVFLVGGNHDRWGTPFWAEEVGIRYAPRSLDVDVAGRKVRAIHGDGLAERGGKVGLVHRLVGHPATSFLFGLLHPDLGLPLVDRIGPRLGDGRNDAAAMAASASRQATWAHEHLRTRPDVDVLVMAHSHVPVVQQHEVRRVYLNPGAWLDGGRYGLIDSAFAELHRFTPAAPPRPIEGAPR